MAQGKPPPSPRRSRYRLFAGAAVLAALVVAAIAVPTALTRNHRHRAAEPTSVSPSQDAPNAATSAVPPNPARRNCSAAPHLCGYPDATNTGVSAGANLTVHSGDLTITQPGYVLQNLEVDGCITVKTSADNVAIKNVLVKGGGCYWPIRNFGATGLTITDVEVDGLNNPSNDAGISCDNCTVTRANIHNTIDGMKVGDNTTVQDSYIHGLNRTSVSHNDGIQCLGTTGLQIRHNTILAGAEATSSVLLSTGSATDMRNISIDNNLVGGGRFTIYGGYNSNVDDVSKVSNIHITNNKFTTQFYSTSGEFGPLTSVDSPVVLSGNLWYDGPNAGQPVTR